MTQRETNPYPYSDSNKRYMTYDWYMKARFGGKIAKLPLEIGCTCPNLDGTRGFGGCIYCKNGSASVSGGSVAEQLEKGRRIAARKWTPIGYIPYFQANSNTYGEPEFLRARYREAASAPGVVMVDIATRADCLGGGILPILEELADAQPVMIELGLQTARDDTASRINRGHTFAEFTDGYARLRDLAKCVNARYPAESVRGLPMKRFLIGVHLINGLPGESADDMRDSARAVAALSPDMVKIHLLHVLRGTPLADWYERGELIPMSRDEYVAVVADQIESLPPQTIIGRVTGDGVADDLLAPLWSRRKTEVSNEIDKELYRRGGYEGRNAENAEGYAAF